MPDDSAISPDKMAPHSVEAEEATIGAAIISPDCVPMLLDIVEPEDFFIVRNAWIWEAIRNLSLRDAPIDYVSILDELQRVSTEAIDPAYVLNLINRTPTALNAEGYADIVARDAVRRRLIMAASEIAKVAHTNDITDPGDLIAKAEAAVMAVAKTAPVADPALSDILSENLDSLSERMRDPGASNGYATGLVDVDKVLNFHPGELVIVAGGTGSGKTALLSQIAAHNCAQGVPVAMISLEMSRQAIVYRIIAAQSGVNLWNILNAQMSGSDLDAYLAQSSKMEKWTLKIPPGVHTIDRLELRIKRYAKELGIQIVVVDYLQLLRSEAFRAGQRVQEVSDISRRLKLAAMENDVLVIAGSQLNRAREARADKRPVLSDLRESGSIEQDSDIVMFIYRQKLHDPDTLVGDAAEIIIAKHRNGPTGMVNVFWDGPHAVFRGAARVDVELGRT